MDEELRLRLEKIESRLERLEGLHQIARNVFIEIDKKLTYYDKLDVGMSIDTLKDIAFDLQKNVNRHTQSIMIIHDFIESIKTPADVENIRRNINGEGKIRSDEERDDNDDSQEKPKKKIPPFFMNYEVPERREYNKEEKKQSSFDTPSILNYIRKLKSEAKQTNSEYLILTAGQVEKNLNLVQRTPMVVNAMKQAMREKDKITRSTQSGYSTTFTVKYYLNYETEAKSMKGMENNFIIRMGRIPEQDKSSYVMKYYEENTTPLVYDSTNTCVGLVWKHYESRPSQANGQAEILFFERYYKIYGNWHRMFDNGYQRGNRIKFNDLIDLVENSKDKEFKYMGYIRP